MKTQTVERKIKKIEKFKKPMTVKELYKLYKDGLIRFDIAIQRNKAWSNEQITLFIDSLLCGYPFPEIYILDGVDVMRELEDDSMGDEKEYLWVLDGQQRLTSVFDFIDNLVILSGDLEPLNGHDLANSNFDNLPEEFKDIIKDNIFEVNQFRDVSIEDIEEIFFRLNNGSGLSRQELNRVRGGIKVIRILNRFKRMEFFVDYVNLGKKSKDKFMDEEMIEQIMMLLFLDRKDFKGYSKKAIGDYVEQLKDNGLSDAEDKKLKNVFNYLTKVSKSMETKIAKKAYKKAHISVVCKVAEEAIKSQDAPFIFAQWMEEFFANTPVDYSELAKSGTGKPERIYGRLEIALPHYLKYKEQIKSRAM